MASVLRHLIGMKTDYVPLARLADRDIDLASSSVSLDSIVIS